MLDLVNPVVLLPIIHFSKLRSGRLKGSAVYCLWKKKPSKSKLGQRDLLLWVIWSRLIWRSQTFGGESVRSLAYVSKAKCVHAISILRLTLIPASPTHPPTPPPILAPFLPPLPYSSPALPYSAPIFCGTSCGPRGGGRDLLWASRRHKFGSTGFFPPHNIQKLPRLGRLASKREVGPTCTNLPAHNPPPISSFIGQKNLLVAGKEKVIKGLIENGRPGRVHNGDINKQPDAKNPSFLYKILQKYLYWSRTWFNANSPCKRIDILQLCALPPLFQTVGTRVLQVTHFTCGGNSITVETLETWADEEFYSPCVSSESLRLKIPHHTGYIQINYIWNTWDLSGWGILFTLCFFRVITFANSWSHRLQLIWLHLKNLRLKQMRRKGVKYFAQLMFLQSQNNRKFHEHTGYN